ncbi:MAG: YidC/Oxa1 family membrane protein insertase [Actinomycetota bacterium]
MAEIIGGIMRALGAALSYIYAGLHNYAIAIIALTLGVRALLLPLTVKSTKSMAAMQKAQPEMKKIQNKYKELQKKARDRMEVQQLRLEMNREMSEVMRAHGANPAGGCLPMLAQFPVLIAMFAVMRVAIPVIATPASGPLPSNTFGDLKNLRNVICRPVDASGNLTLPQPNGSTPVGIRCPLPDGSQKDFTLDVAAYDAKADANGLRDPHTNAPPKDNKAGWISACQPVQIKGEGDLRFLCRSALGTGHLPKDSKLFADVSHDRATIFGMHPGCTATQVSSKSRVDQCTLDPHAGGSARGIPYYLLILIVVATSYYSARQLNERTAKGGGQINPQAQMMARITPVFFGFISLNLPAGANLYFLTQNIWQIGQQHVQFKMQDREEAAGGPPERPKAVPRAALVEDEKPQVRRSGKPQQGSKKRKKRRRR